MTLALQDINKVTKYLTGRYISTSEVIWRILVFNIHKCYPTVMHLIVHLENGQRIYFNPENARGCVDNLR